MVQRLDGPVATHQVGQAGRAGQVEGQAGDRVHGHGLPPVGVQVAGLAGDLDDLGGVREPEPLHRDHLEGAQLDRSSRPRRRELTALEAEGQAAASATR
jgi:hypothetical protein